MPPTLMPLILAASLASGLAAAEDGALVSIAFGDGATVIGKAATVDDRRCCELRGKVVVPVAPWWGDGLRPPKELVCAAEVVFKDTASSPIRVSAYAGLPDRWDLHRIGGAKDGVWKTARIPLPWDMVMRTAAGMAEIAFAIPDGDTVAIESLRIVRGDAAADEARWDAETRTWIARDQAEARAKAKLPPGEATDVAPSGTPAVAYVRPYSRLIQATSAPQATEVGVPLKLTAARGEIEPGQFAVYATGELRNVRASVGDLVLDGQQEKRAALKTELMAAEFAVVGDGSLFPQRLWPAYAVDIPAGRSHPFWLDVETAKDQTPGTYRGEIAIVADGGVKLTLPVEVEVVAIDLLSLHDAGLTMGPCAGWLPAHEVAELARNNHNAFQVWVSSFAPGIVARSATEFDLDFAAIDDFMARAKAAGIERVVWFLGGDPYGFPDTCHLERELYRQVHAQSGSMEPRLEFIRKTLQQPDAVLPEIRDLYRDWVTKVMTHAAEKGWPEIILTPFDEPAKWSQDQNSAELLYYRDQAGHDHVDRPRSKDLAGKLEELRKAGIEWQDLGKGGAGAWIKPHFKDSCALIHAGWPAARVYGSIHHAVPGIVFLDDIDVFCAGYAIHEDRNLGDQVRTAALAKPKVFWQYGGGGDHSDAAAVRYDFGWYFASFDSRGSLIWAYNAGDFWNTANGRNNSVYGGTAPYTVVRSPCYEGLREGWDDRRYLETLRAEARKAGGKRQEEVEAFIHDLLARIALPEGGPAESLEALIKHDGDRDLLDHLREQVRAKILSLR